MSIDSVSGPRVVGVKVMVMVQLCPVARVVAAQLFVSPKSVFGLTPEMLKDAVPAFMIVTVRDGLLVLMA